MIGNAITGELKYLIPDPADLSKMTDTGTSASGIAVDDRGSICGWTYFLIDDHVAQVGSLVGESADAAVDALVASRAKDETAPVLDARARADFIVDAPQTPLSPELGERLAARPEIGTVSPMRIGDFEKACREMKVTWEPKLPSIWPSSRPTALTPITARRRGASCRCSWSSTPSSSTRRQQRCHQQHYCCDIICYTSTATSTRSVRATYLDLFSDGCFTVCAAVTHVD